MHFQVTFMNQHLSSRLKQLSDDVRVLRQQVSTLSASLSTLMEKQNVRSPKEMNNTPTMALNSPAITTSSHRRESAPQQPQFVGPTRSAFSFNIAETSLSKMNLPAEEALSDNIPSNTSSRDATPEVIGRTDTGEVLANYSLAEVIRFLNIYQEEIACVHPIIETKILIENASKILDVVKPKNLETLRPDGIGCKDVHILKIAIATSLIHEHHGKNETSDRLVESVERDVGVISLASEVELKDIQIMGMLV